MGIKTKLRVALQVMVNHCGQILGAIGIFILLVTVIAAVEVMIHVELNHLGRDLD